jgi:hypothetical protein
MLLRHFCSTRHAARERAADPLAGGRAGRRRHQAVGNGLSGQQDRGSDTNERIGSIDDLLIKDPDQAIFAILSVGGFLGIGDHLVVVPFSSLTIDDESRKTVLPGATKGELTKLPEFHYLR